MDSADLVARSRRLIEQGFGAGDLPVLDELMARDVIEHQRGNRSGLDGAKDVVRALHTWMSGFSLTVEDCAVNENVVWLRNRARGINTGSVMGNPPSGQSVELDVFDVLRFRDGLIVEHWGVADQFGLQRQVGAMGGRRAAPEPPATAGALLAADPARA